MPKKTIIHVLLLLACTGLVFLTIYFYTDTFLVYKPFNVGSVSKDKQFLGPYDEVLGVTFQHSYDLMPGASFSEIGLYDARVKRVPTKDRDTIIVSKEGKRLTFPAVGVLGFKTTSTESYTPELVRNLKNKLKVGDVVSIHATYISPLSTLSTEEIRRIHIKQLSDSVIKNEAEMHIMARENSGITESDILARIYSHKWVSFKSSELVVTTVELRVSK